MQTTIDIWLTQILHEKGKKSGGSQYPYSSYLHDFLLNPPFLITTIARRFGHFVPIYDSNFCRGSLFLVIL